ncbi:hypothetical protein BJ912DRAFT_555935 [Pholiota molesta]|nr:hypothetical protein BJ912DRAFT_555935 [Pholiota molesta]
MLYHCKRNIPVPLRHVLILFFLVIIFRIFFFFFVVVVVSVFLFLVFLDLVCPIRTGRDHSLSGFCYSMGQVIVLEGFPILTGVGHLNRNHGWLSACGNRGRRLCRSFGLVIGRGAHNVYEQSILFSGPSGWNAKLWQCEMAQRAKNRPRYLCIYVFCLETCARICMNLVFRRPGVRGEYQAANATGVSRAKTLPACD